MQILILSDEQIQRMNEGISALYEIFIKIGQQFAKALKESQDKIEELSKCIYEYYEQQDKIETIREKYKFANIKKQNIKSRIIDKRINKMQIHIRNNC